MGGSGTDANVNGSNESLLSMMAEVVNQMMGSAACSLSIMFHRAVMISTPEFPLSDMTLRSPSPEIGDEDERLIQIAFKILIEGFIESEILQIMPIVFAKEMSGILISEMDKL
jgi:flagellar motor switch protein FliN/FliY